MQAGDYINYKEEVYHVLEVLEAGFIRVHNIISGAIVHLPKHLNTDLRPLTDEDVGVFLLASLTECINTITRIEKAFMTIHSKKG